jgi:hypothetical protein
MLLALSEYFNQILFQMKGVVKEQSNANFYSQMLLQFTAVRWQCHKNRRIGSWMWLDRTVQVFQ